MRPAVTLAFRLAVLSLLLLAVPLSARAQEAPAQEAPAQGVSVWELAAYKTLTFETAANTADIALFALFFGGGVATAAGFFALNIGTAAASYYTHEVAWTLLGPEPTPETETRIALEKTVSYRAVSIARNLALGGWFGGGDLASTLGFTIAGQVMDAGLYYVNERMWSAYGPPLAR